MAALMTALLPGCVGRGGEPVIVDLVETFSAAEIHREVPVLDLGIVEARPHLGVGWSVDETRKDGLTMVWAVGEVSTVDFFLTEARDLDLELSCSPIRHPDGVPQQVGVAVNGRKIADLELGPGLIARQIRVPADAASAGANALSLTWGHTVIPSTVGPSNDHRRLAARCDQIGFAGLNKAEMPEVSGGDLVIPAGVQVSYYLPIPRSAALEVDGVTGSSGSRIEVGWQVDEMDVQALAQWNPGPDSRILPLLNPSGGPLRVVFRVVGDGNVVLHNPRIRWTGPTPAPDPPLESVDLPIRPNVLVYLVDTLRSDRVGCYGWPEDLTPHLDRLAEESVVFERTIAQTSWTKPSVASIFTGMVPGRHGANGKTSRLPDDVVTMAELLQEGGYATAGFACNAYITRPAGFGQGFDHFSYRQVRSGEITEDVIGWLRAQSEDRPFFLYLHTVDPHAPYNPSDAYRRRFAAGVTDPAVGSLRHNRDLRSHVVDATDKIVHDLLQLYGAEVAENDDSLGRLVEVLRDLGRLDDTLIVFVSDHGEEFMEHGIFGHGSDLHREVLQVPLVIRPPGGTSPSRVEWPAQHVDLLPTILEAAGIEVPAWIDGDSLWRVVNRTSVPRRPRPIFSYLDYEGRRGLAVELDGLKLIQGLSHDFLPARQLFRIESDPGEHEDVSRVYPVSAGYLASLVRAELATYDRVERAEEFSEFDAETREALRALGYIR